MLPELERREAYDLTTEIHPRDYLIEQIGEEMRDISVAFGQQIEL